MQEFELIAKTFMGLEQVLAKELTQLGANNVQIGRRMVSFTGDKEMMYRANFQLHTAIRVLKPIAHFKAKSAEDMYEEVKKIDWSKYILSGKTFSVDSVVYSEEFTNSRFVTYKVKDAIVDQFREKPDLETAERYIKQNNFFWNAGIFIWSASTIVNAFRIYQPGVARIFERIMDVLGTDEEQRVIDEVYPECENISVDYAIMEKAEEIFVCPADFGWSDLGTWGSLLAQTQHDIYGNTVIGKDVRLFDSRNCIVHTTEEQKVVIQGLDGYIVAEQNGKLLICRLSEEQRLKQFTGEG